jgi:cardiolipin synthase
LIGLATVPYVAIPLYIVLGERKLKHATRRGRRVAMSTTTPDDVRWLDRPELARAAFLDGIQSARASIRMSTFILGSDPVGREIVHALAERARAGVDVRLTIDGLWARRAPDAELRVLRRAGGKVRVFLPLLHLPWHGRSNVRNHRKVAVFDGARAIVGGMNLAAEYLAPGAWRDLSIEIAGDPARVLASVFDDDWELCGGEPGAPMAEVRRDPLGFDDSGHDRRDRTGPVEIIPAGPDHHDDPWRDTLIDLVRGARSRLWIATPYFAPDETLLRTVESAARRGVDVVVVVPDRSNHWIADRVAAPLLREVARAGGRVFRFLPTMMHAKAVLVDDSVAAVGTANFDMRSLFLDFEVTVVLRGREYNSRLAAWFEETIASSAGGPLPERGGFDRAAEVVTRLIAPIV